MVRVAVCGFVVVKFITAEEKAQELVAGSPLQLSSTVPKFVAVGVTVTDTVPLWPVATVIEDGFAATLKLAGIGGGPGVPRYSYTPISTIALLRPFAF